VFDRSMNLDLEDLDLEDSDLEELDSEPVVPTDEAAAASQAPVDPVNPNQESGTL
jgi:hypothetical protein